MNKPVGIEVGEMIIGYSMVMCSGNLPNDGVDFAWAVFEEDIENKGYQSFSYYPERHEWQIVEPPPVEVFLIPSYGIITEVNKNSFVIIWMDTRERDNCDFIDFRKSQNAYRAVMKTLRSKEKAICGENLTEKNRDQFGFVMDVLK